MIAPLRLKARLKARQRAHRLKQRLHHAHEVHCTSLCCGHRGDALQITELVGSEHDAARLRDLGVREGARVTILRDGDPLMIKVDNARFGLSRAAAINVHCEFCAKATSH
jgi:Fe2+ transport system protein FeoA